jgi:hypothetical protein
MHVDFKITTWERCEIPDLNPEELEQLKDKIKDGDITCWEDLESELGRVDNTEIILEVEEYMTPEENGGCPTVELYVNKGESATATNTDPIGECEHSPVPSNNDGHQECRFCGERLIEHE